MASVYTNLHQTAAKRTPGTSRAPLSRQCERLRTYDRPWMKDRIRIAPEGYVSAPTKPGLGYEIDRGVLDNLTERVER